jgi:4-amino-4-deoxy-L-arabinose transferase-like glycosyltransferase
MEYSMIYPDLLDNKMIFKTQIIVYGLFTVLLIVALFLRLYNLDYMEFKGDEALNSFKALELVEEGVIPLTSLTSTTGINEPPIFVYFLAVPYFFTPNPVVATTFIALMNVFGIALCFFFLKKYFGSRAALFGTAFYAVNPWQVLFSRKIWTQNLVAPFIMMFIYFMYNAVHDNKKHHVIYALIALGFVLQLHLSAAFFIGVFIITVIRYREQINWKYFSVGIVSFLLTFTPYMIFQIKSNFIDFHSFFTYLNQENVFQIKALTLPFLLVTTRGFDYSLGASYQQFLDSSISIPIFDFLQVAILFFAFIYMNLSWKKKGFILNLWLMFGVLFHAFSKIQTLNHYYLPLLPLFFIAIGTFLSWISRLGKGIKLVVLILTLILFIYQLTFNLHFLNFIKDQTCIYGDYGPPYAHRYTAIENLISQLESDTISKTLWKIHTATCNCRHCYIRATEYIIKLIEPTYYRW